MVDESTQIMAARPLPVGHQLLWYEIEEILGQGGFGITYLATDTNLNRKVAIKEYLPTIFAYRNEDFTVAPLTGDHGDNYDWGLTSFLNEARTLAQFRHRNVVQVQTVFENHNTAYMVMEYEHGDSLSRLISQQREQLDQGFYESLLFPVMDGLQDIHDAGFIHRDIKPANIYLRSDGSPVLIDFGSARETSQQDTGEMTTLVSQGYTPLEQYSSNFGDQGPWTDIYSFAASVYHGIVGKRSVDALNRSAGLLAGKEDPLKPLSSMGLSNFSPVFLSAIDQAMMLKPDERPQSLSEWRALFGELQGGNAPAPSRARTQPSAAPAEPEDPADFTRVQLGGNANRPSADAARSGAATGRTERKSPVVPIAAAAVLVLALGAGGWWYTRNAGPGLETGARLTPEMVANLPRPSAATPLIAPSDRLATELADLKSLSTIYQQALAIDASSQPAREGIAYVVGQYSRLAQSPFVTANQSFRSQLRDALSGLARFEPDATRLVGQLADNSAAANFSSLTPLLDKATLSSAEQQQLLAGLASLQGADKATARQDNRVVALSTRFTKTIVRRVEQGDFDQAARMIEVALLISPDDDGLNLLKRHIEGRS